MKIGFLITARLKSSRLRLKLLEQLGDELVIEHVINRAKAVKNIDDIVLCTSVNPQDFPLVQIAKDKDIYYFCGDEDDVLKRLNDACKFFGFDFVVCITADNPLFSIYHANLIVDMVKQDRTIDFITTVGMPIGVNIYGVKANALKTVCEIKQELDTEIWGYYFKKDLFNVVEVKVDEIYRFDCVKRLTLDYVQDLILFKEIYKRIDSKIVDILDVYALLKNDKKLQKINSDLEQKDLDDEIKNSIDEYFSKNIEYIKEIKKRIYEN